MRGHLAQDEMSESLSSDLVSVLALGDVDPLGRSGLSADAAIRRMHTNLAHAFVPDMQRMLMAARAPQPILDAVNRFSCAQCDAMTTPKIPRGVSVPQTVAPLRYVAMDVKWLPGWEEDVRIKSVNLQTFFHSSRQKHRKFCCDCIVNGEEPMEGPVGSKLMRVGLFWEKPSNELTVPNFGMFLERHMNRLVGSKCMVVILKTCWHEFWLRFGQALGLSGWSAFTRPWKPKILSQEDAVTVLFR